MSEKTFKPIRLDNKDAIIEALDAVNGRAIAFVATYRSLLDAAEWAERRLDDLGAVQADRIGAVAEFRPAGPTANAYKYGAKSTYVRFQRRSMGWYVIAITEAQVYPKNPKLLKLSVRPAARDAMAERYLRGFGVLAA